jgi:RNA exonuclease 1
MDLIKLKIEQGQGFGEYYNDQESIFSRIKRYSRPRTSAVIDDESVINSEEAITYIRTTSDAEVVAALPQAMAEHHFVWARLRDLEIAYGKAGPNVQTGSGHHPDQGRAAFLSYENRVDPTEEEVRAAAKSVDKSLAAIVEAMPANTAFLVTSGQGDPRDMLKYQELQKRFQTLYNTVSISSIAKEDRFDDEAQAALELGAERAKNGLCFFMVK